MNDPSPYSLVSEETPPDLLSLWQEVDRAMAEQERREYAEGEMASAGELRQEGNRFRRKKRRGMK